MDKEFYVMQSEIYGDEGEDGVLEFNYQKGLDEAPTMVGGLLACLQCVK